MLAFKKDANSCLAVQGEQILKNLKEGEKGFDLHLDIQMIDINTCEPLKDIAVEIWAANATGVRVVSLRP